MTAVDLTAIVESVARERFLSKVKGVDPRLAESLWAGTEASGTRDAYCAEVIPIVHATLTALMPLADGWEDMARSNEAQADDLAARYRASEDDDYALTASQRAYTARDVHNSCAKALRQVMGS